MAVTPAQARTAARACVVHHRCFASLQQALDAAPPGATIRLSRGRFTGGVSIRRDVHLVGAGPGRTVVHGGGPVVLVVSTSSSHPSVVLHGMSIVGGVTHGDSVDPGTVNAIGGGLLVAPDPRQRGASVHLSHVVVSDNRTVPTQLSSSPSGVQCPHGFCPYAGSFGGGIASWGNLWLDHSRVVHNTATGRASDADGGGIYVANGSLHVVGSVVAGNSAVPRKIGRFAEGGGVFVSAGRLSVRRTVITRNAADLVTGWPVHDRTGGVIDMNSNSGGLHIGDGIDATLDRVSITRNTTRTVDPPGEALAFDSGMLVGDSHLTMHRSIVARNLTYARVATTQDVGPSGTAMELDGPGLITGTRIVGNRALTSSDRGEAGATAGLAVYDFSSNPRQVVFRHGLIAGNLAFGRSRHGTASAVGGGVFNNSLLRLTGVVVRGNTVRARAPHATAQGGGIWNGPFLSGPPVKLVLEHVGVLRNTAAAHEGSAQGGGIFTTVPITRQHTRLVGNHPGQCQGCG